MSFSSGNRGGSTTPTMLSSLNLEETAARGPHSLQTIDSNFNSTTTARDLTPYESGASADLVNKYSLSERLSACQADLRVKERMLRRLRTEQEDQLGLLCR